jgi:hypothetical protein
MYASVPTATLIFAAAPFRFIEWSSVVFYLIKIHVFPDVFKFMICIFSDIIISKCPSRAEM